MTLSSNRTALPIAATLAAKGVQPTPEHLRRLETKWAEIQTLAGDLTGADLDDADIAVRNIPGGDHVE